MTTRRNDHDAFPMSVDQEVADYLVGIVHPELYHNSKLSKYLLPNVGQHNAAEARLWILQARACERAMAAGPPRG